ncbi:MAG: type II secretion system F family protein [Pseudomonadota bacterium]
MPLFSYKARGVHGDAIEGTIDAGTPDLAAARLIESGLTPVEVNPFVEKLSLGSNLETLFSPPVRNADLIQFSRQMYSMLRAGVPIFRAVSGLASTTGNRSLAQTLHRVAADLETGHPLSDAFAHHPRVFSLFYVSLVRVGETSGKLTEIFQQLAFYLDREKTTRARIKSALRYPTFVISAILIALGVISIWVIPAFSSLFSRFGAELPLPTRILMLVSEFMVAYWPYLLLLLALLTGGARYYIGTADGRYRWDKFKLHLPLVGRVIYQATLARFSHLFAMAMNAGVPLMTALTVVAQALNNNYLEERILGMRGGIEHGKALSLTATNSGVFDPLVLQMLAVGEESGTISELLTEVADYYEREVDYATERLSSAIEPILTVVIGGLVLVMAMGIFLPMWNLASVALH